MREGLTWVGVKLYVPTPLRTLVLKTCHDSKAFWFYKNLTFGQMAILMTVLQKDIESYAASCPVCASAKRRPGKHMGLLQPVANSYAL